MIDSIVIANLNLIFNKRNRMDATSGAETDYPSGEQEFPRF
jgi:hypothetical protein